MSSYFSESDINRFREIAEQHDDSSDHELIAEQEAFSYELTMARLKALLAEYDQRNKSR